MTYTLICKLREAAAVKRYHTKRTIRTQNLADHTYGILQIILAVDPQPSLNLIKAAMHHDLAEVLTGDIPAPAKRMFPDLREALQSAEHSDGQLSPVFELTDDEQALLKWADTAELCFWCLEEYLMGNRLAFNTFATGVNYLMEQSLVYQVYLHAREVRDELLTVSDKCAKEIFNVSR
jgi:5'-deoxynucleotidase YfbR-like HD superfamily hydrolase